VRRVTTRAEPGGSATAAPVPAVSTPVDETTGILAVRRSRRLTPAREAVVCTNAAQAVHEPLAIMAAYTACATALVALNPAATWPCRTFLTCLPLARFQTRSTSMQLGMTIGPAMRPRSGIFPTSWKLCRCRALARLTRLYAQPLTV